MASSSDARRRRSAAVAGQPGDLGAQLVAGAAAAGGDVGVGLGLQLGDLGLEPGPAVGEQRLGLGVGLGEQSLALGLDVAERLADSAASASASRRRCRGVVELALDLVGAVAPSPSSTSGPAFQISNPMTISEASPP